MTTASAGRHRCIACEKTRATLRCGGCLQEFCFNHILDHRQQLSQQLDQVELNRDLFRQTLTEQTTDLQKHPLIDQVNNWEYESIKKIQQIAEEARQKLLTYITKHTKQIEIDLNKLTDQLRQSREENDYYETDLRQWTEELKRLTNELNKPSNVNFRQETTSLITNQHGFGTFTGRCYNCHQIGHKRWNCPGVRTVDDHNNVDLLNTNALIARLNEMVQMFSLRLDDAVRSLNQATVDQDNNQQSSDEYEDEDEEDDENEYEDESE